jgi:hypothetical protein
MPPTSMKKAIPILSGFVAGLVTIASAVGLFVPHIYHDNLFVASGWRGNDWVTLLVAIPVLVLTTILCSKGSRRAQLIRLGLLYFFIYHYAFYLFGAAFNQLFLIYVGIIVTAGFALICSMLLLDPKEAAPDLSPKSPMKWIGIYMFLVAAGLTFVYTSQSIAFVTSGKLPEIVIKTGLATNAVFALDFLLVIPIFASSAVMLWQRKPHGYVLASIANVMGSMYMIAIGSATAFVLRSGASDNPSELGLWVCIGLGCLISSIILIGKSFPLNP